MRLACLVLLASTAISAAGQQVVPAVLLDQPVTGSLTPDDPTLGNASHYDYWTFRGEPGTRVRILLTSRQFDTYLSVGRLTADTFETTEFNDDFNPPETDSRLDATVPATGEFTIRVHSYAAGETGDYDLLVTRAPDAAEGGVRPIAPGTAAGAEFVEAEPYTRDSGEPAHFWQFDAVAGARYAITLYSAEVDTYLSVGYGDPDQFTAVEDNDDVDDSTDSRIIFTADRTGTVTIRASIYGTVLGPYRIAIQRLEAR